MKAGVLSAACPWCGARAGQPCQDPYGSPLKLTTGGMVEFHSSRLKAFRESKDLLGE